MATIAPLLIAALVLLPDLARAASFTPLGGVPDSAPIFSYSRGISDDGTVVVGDSHSEGFRWESGTMVGLGIPPDYWRSYAQDVSGDGTVVVGGLSGNTSVEAVRWSGGVMTTLGHLDGSSTSFAAGVSANGEVVVGDSGNQAARWVSGAVTGLGFLPGGTYSRALGVSGDGQVVVGLSEDSAGAAMAFRWSNGAMSSLSHYPADLVFSHAVETSADGAFVVGLLQVDGGRMEAFRWTEGEMLQLGYLSEDEYDYSIASSVSADGAVVVGSTQSEAFVWTEQTGMELLIDVLAARGATGLAGWRLYEAMAISPDGRWVAGAGINPDGRSEAFLADLSPVPAPSAAWLLGSALAAWACARRRTA